MKEKYPCKNFNSNGYLRILYLIYLLYLWASANQIRKGFPLKLTTSTLLKHYNPIAKLTTSIALAIPFIIEIRCLIDYLTSKTSLNYSEFCQLFIYHK